MIERIPPKGGSGTAPPKAEPREPLSPPTEPEDVAIGHDRAAVARDVYIAGLETGHAQDKPVVAAGRCLIAYFGTPDPVFLRPGVVQEFRTPSVNRDDRFAAGWIRKHEPTPAAKAGGPVEASGPFSPVFHGVPTAEAA